MTKNIGLLALCLLILSAVLFGRANTETARSQANQASSDYPFVAIYDLGQAGFTQVIPMYAQNGRFETGASYFKVSDKAVMSREAPDIVMVNRHIADYAFGSINGMYAYADNSQAFYLEGGAGKEAILPDYRIAISFIKGKNYVVVIGPKKEKIERLATNLAKKL